mgnify:CR=1 FL=1
MQVFRIDQIKFDPLTVVAQDSDHAAQMFIYALMTGLRNQPTVDFSTSEWIPRRVRRFPVLEKWIEEGRAGIVWRVDEDPAWEIVSYDFHQA